MIVTIITSIIIISSSSRNSSSSTTTTTTTSSSMLYYIILHDIIWSQYSRTYSYLPEAFPPPDAGVSSRGPFARGGGKIDTPCR